MTGFPGPALRPQLAAGTALALFAVLAGLALARGLTGTFIFDDFSNLTRLERIVWNPTWREALRYVFDGVSSTLGRPLALATFAAQYPSWPSHPGDFIRVNILLHLLNGALLAWALLRLGRLLRLEERPALVLAVGSAALWLLAPLHTSAVLYVVQRMAVLAGTFAFAGVLLYLVGRERLVRGQARAGFAWMTAGLAVGAGMGVLAKENAALLPLGLLALEATLLAGVARTPAWRWWAPAFLVAPTVLLVLYVAAQWPAIERGYALREFTPGERLLTEGRVLFLYLYKLAFPSLSSLRLLYDDLPVSRGLLDPWTTLAALAAWAALLVAAVRARRRHPVFAFAVLWFLAHHLLESTIYPLEIAFEHRNYVASVGPLLALVWYFRALLESDAARRLRIPLLAAAAAYVLFQATALWMSATLWGRPNDLSRYWARTQPDSVRAQLQVVDTDAWEGDLRAAVRRLDAARERWPGDLTMPLMLMHLGCFAPEGPVPPLDEVRATAARFHGQMLSSINMAERVVHAYEEGACDRYPPGLLLEMLGILLGIPEFGGQERNLMLLHSRVAEAAGDRTLARTYLDRAIRISPTASLLEQGVSWAAEACDFELAREYVGIGRAQAPESRFRRWLTRWSPDELGADLERYIALQDRC